MPREDVQVEATDGTRIAAYRWRPEGDPRGLVQIVHGLAEHAVRYDRFAQALTAAGWAVVAHDHRGHGATASTEADLGTYADRDGWAKVTGDVATVRAAMRAEVPEGPVVLFGHSMGSFISLYAITGDHRGIDRLVLSGSAKPGGPLVTVGGLVARFERFRLGARKASGLLTSMSFGDFNKAFQPNRTEFDWLSRDDAEVDKYVNDPLCGFDAKTQLWIDFLGGLNQLGSADRYRRLPPELPVYIMSGDRDPVGGAGKAVRELDALLRAGGLQNVTLKLYPDGRHELLNETNRDEVTADLIAWLS